MSRTIIVDEDCDHRIAKDLLERGRAAESHKTVGTTGLVDEAVLEALARLHYPWVLVTGDDKMPYEHAATIARLGSTIATIDGEWEKCCAASGLTLTEDQYRKETVQRWAHVIAAQAEREIRRYNPIAHRPWKPRRKYVRL